VNNLCINLASSEHKTVIYACASHSGTYVRKILKAVYFKQLLEM